MHSGLCCLFRRPKNIAPHAINGSSQPDVTMQKDRVRPRSLQRTHFCVLSCFEKRPNNPLFIAKKARWERHAIAFEPFNLISSEQTIRSHFAANERTWGRETGGWTRQYYCRLRSNYCASGLNLCPQRTWLNFHITISDQIFKLSYSHGNVANGYRMYLWTHLLWIVLWIIWPFFYA